MSKQNILKVILVFYFITIILSPLITGAHFIVGIANNANDGMSANGKAVILWNPSNGIGDNLTDIVGTSGNSGADNIYLIDCELFQTPCNIGDEIRVMILDIGDGYESNYSSLIVTGAGFDIMSNITLNSLPEVSNIRVEDIFKFPLGEIDLNPFSTRQVICNGTVRDYDGEGSIYNITSEFFDNTLSYYGDGNDNNYHYRNNSCFINSTYGTSNEIYFECGYFLEYYSNPGNWNCTIDVHDSFVKYHNNSNISLVNTLLAISVNNSLDFGVINNSESVSNETTLSVTNAGNSMLNLSLSGYGENVNDNLSMKCSFGQNISIDYLKFNLSSSHNGNMNLSDFEANYTNLTSEVVVKRFDLHYRKYDPSAYIDDTNLTYWRIYVPIGIESFCEGNIVIGATSAPGSG